MSKIYRSIDAKLPFIKTVDPRQTRLEGAAVKRPLGGFFGARPGSGEAPVSYAEKRELEARRMIEEAESRAEAIQREAYHAGFEEGERAGRKLAVQKSEPAMQTLAELVAALGAERESLIQRNRADLIKVAFLIAERTIHRTIEQTPELVADVVAAALEKVAKSQEVVLHLAPQDHAMLEQMLSEVDPPFAGFEKMKLIADESVGRGGCRVVIPAGDIDATIEGQLRALKSALW